ncbi:NmrA family NAD(P)-binding protein [Azospirillum sp.]|uniref:NmrA family NAD(P)-binding protein n=1 Tax=Azospirillum sp. TaxID=34012 RepID=UPI003D74E21C
MYVVTGVTGNTGAVVAETLLARGEAVRVLVRDAGKAAKWAARGVEVVEGNVKDAAAVARALAGAKGAYLLDPPDYGSRDPMADADAVGAAYAEAIRKTALPHAVVLSSIAAHHPDGTGIIGTLHRMETILRGAGAPVTFLRAAYFMENWGNVLEPALGQGVLPSFIHPLDKALPMVSVADIGRTAADLLLEGARGVRVVELSGPAEASPADAAAAIGAAAGRAVQAVAVPRGEWAPTLAGVGFPPDVVALFVGMYDGINNGRVAWEGQEARRGAATLDAALRRLVEGRKVAA